MADERSIEALSQVIAERDARIRELEQELDGMREAAWKLHEQLYPVARAMTDLRRVLEDFASVH